MHNGFAIIIAWPETLCKQPGAWYDWPLHYMKISRNGYYRAGHAAVVLIDDKTQSCRYFDFGRYHAPHGHGRVRSSETDHDLMMETKAIISEDQSEINNLHYILDKLSNNPSTHGTGHTYGTTIRVNYTQALLKAKKIQQREFIPYGPFVFEGTNCSRFVNNVVRAGRPLLKQRIKLSVSPTLSPTTMWNLRATGNKIICVDGLSDRYSFGKVQETIVI